MKTYRDRIYENYSSGVQGQSSPVSDRDAERWSVTTMAQMKGLLPQDRDARIVEVACGYGRFLHVLKSRGYTNVMGVDISPEQVRLARAVTPKVELADSIAFLEETDERFDLIVCMDMIEHLYKEEVLRFLDASLRALAPGGRLVLTTLNSASPFEGHHRYSDFTHEVSFSPTSIGYLLTAVGFESVECREQGPVPHGFVSTVRYVLWRLLRLGIFAWNLIEMGEVGSRVVTQLLIASAVKPK